MASASLILVVLWQRSPILAVALVGPLLAISLYQRSTYRALRAMRLALTDPLTGLGNHRHFHERLQRELVAAEEADGLLSLCLVDLDDFKQINDRYGHPAATACCRRSRRGCDRAARRSGSAATSSPCCCRAATRRRRRDGRARSSSASRGSTRARGPVTVSAGVATYPVQGVGRDELIRLADSALYWAKEHGKNRVRAYRPEVGRAGRAAALARGADRAARFRAAASLARAVDARDAYTGSHSQRVGELAARSPRRLASTRSRSS